MKTYSDIVGDGGSNVINQVVALQKQIQEALSGITHLVAIGSGKGGVGKSTVTMVIALTLRELGYSVSILDSDFNGPSISRLAGIQTAIPIPGKKGLVVPRNADGIGVISMGSFIPESRSLEFETVATGDSHTWRATKEFSTLADILRGTEWGHQDFLLFDLPPGAERTVQYADFLGKNMRLVLITNPSDLTHGVVSRSLAALKNSGHTPVGTIQNMSGYFCPGCEAIKPLFASSPLTELSIPKLGEIPFHPDVAALCDIGLTRSAYFSIPGTREIRKIVTTLIHHLES